MKVGIICAIAKELEPFLSHIENHREIKYGKLTFHEGTINGVDIVAVQSGICKTNAAIGTQILISNFNVDMIINSGTAGGMNKNLNLFDTVVGIESIHHDIENEMFIKFQSWTPSTSFPSNEKLIDLTREALKRTSYKAHFGRIVSGEQFITDEGRDEINESYEPLSVDMESASISQVCYVNEIPFIAIRTLTDTATHKGLGNFDQNCAVASNISKEVVLELLNEIKSKYKIKKKHRVFQNNFIFFYF